MITLLEKVYGWKRPGPNEPKVTVRVEVVEEDWIGDRESLELAGVELAKALGRDSGAWVGHGVIITEGAIESCGSVKNWRVKAEAGTTFMIRDIPLSTARCMSDAARTLDLEVDYEQQQ